MNQNPGYPPQGGMYAQPPPEKKGMSAAGIVLIVLGVLFLAGAGTCATCTCLAAKGVSDVKDKMDAEDKKAQANAVTVPIDKFLAAYKANDVAADGQYKGRYVTLTGGTIYEIHANFADSAEVWLNNSGSALEHPVAICVTKNKSAAASLKKGGKATVKGKNSIGLAGNSSFGIIRLENCEIR